MRVGELRFDLGQDPAGEHRECGDAFGRGQRHAGAEDAALAEADNGGARRGDAVGVLHLCDEGDFIVADDPRRGALAELMPGYRVLTLGIHALYSSRKHLPIKTRRLVDCLVQAFMMPAWSVAR